jgi:hypothetical protein
MIVNGQVTEDIIIALIEPEGRIIIHPPRSYEKRFAYQSPERNIWVADIIEIDIETKVAFSASREEIEQKIKPIAEEYLKRFLRYFRAETRQFHIDLRQSIGCNMVYVDQSGHEQKCGYLTLKTMHLGEPPGLDDGSWMRISEDLIHVAQIPFQIEAFLDAKLYQSYGDYRMAAVSAAMGIEAITTKYLRKTLGQKLVVTHRVTQSQVDKYIEQISNRLLVTIGLGLTSTIDKEILEGCRMAMQLRNDILHGMKKSISSKESREAIRSLEQLMSAKEILDTTE